MRVPRSRSLVGAGALVVIGLVVWLLVPSTPIHEPHPAPTGPTDLVQQLAVPAYVDPGSDPGTWATLAEGKPEGVGVVVANVASGPGSGAVAAWSSVLGRAHDNGTKVLGYVDTGYLGTSSSPRHEGLPTRSGSFSLSAWEAQAESDIDAWYRYYGAAVDGIFLDQGASSCGPSPSSDLYADTYWALSAYVKRAHPGALVALNPGINVPRCFQVSADVLVTFEGTYQQYVGSPSAAPGSYQPLDWTPSNPDRIWHIVYSAGSEAEMEQAMAVSKRRGAGLVYVTDSGQPNPFDGLPPYWSAEQEQRDR